MCRCIIKFVFPKSSAQMIHEDGGSRSKGSPAGKDLLQFYQPWNQPGERRSKKAMKIQGHRYKTFLTLSSTIQSHFMSLYDSTLPTFFEQWAIKSSPSNLLIYLHGVIGKLYSMCIFFKVPHIVKIPEGLWLQQNSVVQQH